MSLPKVVFFFPRKVNELRLRYSVRQLNRLETGETMRQRQPNTQRRRESQKVPDGAEEKRKWRLK